MSVAERGRGREGGSRGWRWKRWRRRQFDWFLISSAHVHIYGMGGNFELIGLELTSRGGRSGRNGRIELETGLPIRSRLIHRSIPVGRVGVG
nr:MAG: hypothetical protein EDM05_23510 [Leptolyngbya sp. IPPAS B-1204]